MFVRVLGVRIPSALRFSTASLVCYKFYPVLTNSTSGTQLPLLTCLNRINTKSSTCIALGSSAPTRQVSGSGVCIARSICIRMISLKRQSTIRNSHLNKFRDGVVYPITHFSKRASRKRSMYRYLLVVLFIPRPLPDAER